MFTSKSECPSEKQAHARFLNVQSKRSELCSVLQETDSEAALSVAELCRGRDGCSGDCQWC